MAPVLLCPECGTKHPLDGVNGSAFPCRGCGRTLKVPEQTRVAAAPVLPAMPVVGDPSATGVMPAPKLPPQPVASASRRRPRARSGPIDSVPSRWIRFALWIVAVPLAFLIVFALARVIGVLSTNQVEDVALDTGWNRFVPIVRLLPFVALVMAGLVQGGVYGITRFRARRSGPPIPERVSERV